MAARASRTAEGVAVLRAVHQLVDPPPRLVDDPVSVRLLTSDERRVVDEHPERFDSPRARALRTHVLLRSRWAEEELERAVRAGTDQYVVLGAGLDTFAYRRPAWAGGLRVFEVDQPASQAAKRERLRAAGLPEPAGTVYGAVDLESEPLSQALDRIGVDGGRPLFTSWLGVAMYLSPDAVRSVLEVLARYPAGSGLVLSYARPLPPGAGPGWIADRAAGLGEPFRSFHEPDEMVAELRAAGFRSVHLLSPQEAADRWFGDRPGGLTAPSRISMAAASV
ncbi:class I SAM-dependent methyltransferase [Nakamurella endophytica]|uniref:S-adenosyl-L-methionine-dependent methyltransferase n=1 Tax=Nakamurella endophytica TaxID=1748367 RepID=A0A917WFZ9_9ACTN|nr:class I SAM-dependent methyltransferase [Nakamurella endophytica]GGL99781.1 S-adenosyl-L-methionine-dependent methyltransferase [Nakamurella endophytica]